MELVTPASLKEHLREQSEGQVAWLVLLYASWSSACLVFDSTFAGLSLQYAKADKLRFGKLEVSRCLFLLASWKPLQTDVACTRILLHMHTPHFAWRAYLLIMISARFWQAHSIEHFSRQLATTYVHQMC